MAGASKASIVLILLALIMLSPDMAIEKARAQLPPPGCINGPTYTLVPAWLCLRQCNIFCSARRYTRTRCVSTGFFGNRCQCCRRI